jgi:hypothetical protein
MDQAQEKVIIESPYAGEVELNVAYLQSCLRDSLLRGEAPFASHGLYTQPGVLRDDVPEERELGMRAGFAWRDAAELTVFYVDRGFSGGMVRALNECMRRDYPFEFRSVHERAYQRREHP